MQTYKLDSDPYTSKAKPLCFYLDTESAISLSDRFGSHLQKCYTKPEKLLIITWLSLLLHEEQDTLSGEEKGILEISQEPSYASLVLPLFDTMIEFIDSLSSYQKHQFMLFLATDLS